jgi:hypothetical protein
VRRHLHTVLQLSRVEVCLAVRRYLLRLRNQRRQLLRTSVLWRLLVVAMVHRSVRITICSLLVHVKYAVLDQLMNSLLARLWYYCLLQMRIQLTLTLLRNLQFL